MTKQAIIAVSVAAAALLASCNPQPAQNGAESANTEVVTPALDTIVTLLLTDSTGNTLEMIFDNPRDVVTIRFNGDSAELASQKAASGIWYSNERYDLSGKGNDIRLTRDGQLVFEHVDEKVSVEVRNAKGEVLRMTFNNSAGTVRAYLNDGEQIEMTAQKSASGIWFKNSQYELLGKGDRYELLKDGKTVFKN